MSTRLGKVQWQQASLAAILQYVRPSRFIWDPKDPSYRKKNLRQETFNAIAEKLKLQYSELSEIDGGTVRLKFKNLRTYFMGAYRKMQYDPTGIRWSLFEDALYMADSLDDQSQDFIVFTEPTRPEPVTSFHPTPPPSDPDVIVSTNDERYISDVDCNITEVTLSDSEDDTSPYQCASQLSPGVGSNSSSQSMTSIFTVSGITNQQETESSSEHSPYPVGRKRKRNADTSDTSGTTGELYKQLTKKPHTSSYSGGKSSLGADADNTHELHHPKSDTINICEQSLDTKENVNMKMKGNENDSTNMSGTKAVSSPSKASHTSSLAAGMGQIVEAVANKLPYHKQVELLGKIYEMVKTVAENDQVTEEIS